MKVSSRSAKIWLAAIVCVLLFAGCLLMGSVRIAPKEVLLALAGSDAASPTAHVIVVLSRLPAAIGALLCGAALAVAGLQMQTTFANPLAGPSIMGISSGASLGVAVAMLGFGGALTATWGLRLVSVGGALVGATAVLGLLLGFSRMVRSTSMLLIVGIILGYLASSAISLLNFFATQEGVHSFVIWGMGGFGSLTLDNIAVFAPLTIAALGASFLFVKPLDAMQLGEVYATGLGVNVKVVRGWLILLSGLLTAVATAFCGPIAFIGLIVPHISRMWMGTCSHLPLLASTALCGSAVMLLCQLICVLPSSGVIPVNAVTPVIGAPIIIYVILNRQKIFYMGQ